MQPDHSHSHSHSQQLLPTSKSEGNSSILTKSSASTTKKRTRPVSACEPCRRKKIKCVLQDDQPVCKACRATSTDCRFNLEDLDPSLRADSRFSSFTVGENARQVVKSSKSKKTKVDQETESDEIKRRTVKEKGEGKDREKGKGKQKATGERTTSSSSSPSPPSPPIPTLNRITSDFNQHHRQQKSQYQYHDHQFQTHPQYEPPSSGWAAGPSNQASEKSPHNFSNDFPHPNFRLISNSTTVSSSAAASPSSSSSPNVGISSWSSPSASSRNQTLPSFKTTFHHLDSERDSKVQTSSPNLGLHSMHHQPNLSSPSFNPGIVHQAPESGSFNEDIRSNVYQTVDNVGNLPASHNFLSRWYAFEKPKALPTFDNPGKIWDPNSSPSVGISKDGEKSTAGTMSAASNDRQNASIRIYEERLKKREENEKRKREEMEKKQREEMEKKQMDAASALVSVKNSSSPPKRGNSDLESTSASTSTVGNGTGLSPSNLSSQDLENKVFGYLNRRSLASSNSKPILSLDRGKGCHLTLEQLQVFNEHCSEICPWFAPDPNLFVSEESSVTVSEESKLFEHLISSISISIQLKSQPSHSSKSELSCGHESTLESKRQRSIQMCKDAMIDLFNSPSIKGIQIFYLMALQEHLDSHINSQYLFIGLAWRMCQLLGIDKLKGIDQDSEEVRNQWNLVRCVASYDKWLHSQIGRSSDIDLSQLSQSV